MELDFGEIDGKKRKKTERREHDAYMTPPALVEAIVVQAERSYFRHHYAIERPVILEPSCGDGEFIAALRKTFATATIVGIDIRPELREKVIAAGASAFLDVDFLTTPPLPGADLIIGNPPFDQYCAFVEHCLKGMQTGATLAFLSRLNHLVGSATTPVIGPLSAQAWWLAPLDNGLSPNRQILEVHPVFPRPSFTGGGTDATEYGMIVWRKGLDNGGAFEPVTWTKPETRGRKKKTVTGG